MIDKSILEEGVTDIFRHTLNFVPPSVDTDLFADGGLDSLMLVDLLFKLEKTFNLTIPLETLELNNFRSVASIADFIARSLDREVSAAGVVQADPGKRRALTS